MKFASKMVHYSCLSFISFFSVFFQCSLCRLSQFYVPTTSDLEWSRAEPLCKCLLSPITQLAALPRCSALHALLGLHHHAHFVEHGFVVCRPILPFASSMQCLKVQRSIFCLSRISRAVFIQNISLVGMGDEDASEALPQPKVTK